MERQSCPRRFGSLRSGVSALTMVGLLCWGCGRTEPVRGLWTEVGGAGIDAGRTETLLVDLDDGLLTGHALDGGAGFQVRVGPQSSARQLERLGGGTEVVSWSYPVTGYGIVVGLTGRDGATPFAAPPTMVDFLAGWVTTRHGAVGESWQGGFLVEGSVVHRFSRKPVGGVVAGGLVPTVDASRTVHWLDARTDTVRRTASPEGALTFRGVGDRLIFTTTRTVTESDPTGDVSVELPFNSPQVLAANGVRQALVVDPAGPGLQVVDFARRRLDPVNLSSATPPGVSFDRALALDDEGFIYATFAGRTTHLVMRTANLGSTWTAVVGLTPPELTTAVHVERRGRSLLVVGGVSGALVVDWGFAAHVDLRDDTTTVLAIDARTTLEEQLPVTMTEDGRLLAFWKASAEGPQVAVFDADSRLVTSLETRPRTFPMYFRSYPPLAWLR